MRALLLYPKFRPSYWSFEKVVELVGRRAMMPPLGLITVAAILPQDWEFRLRDRNIEAVSEDDWAWAEIVLLSGMLVQKADLHAAIAEAQTRGLPVAVGGPYATALPEEVAAAGADFLVLDEGEITIPLWLADLERGATGGRYTAGGEKPDITRTPIPRFDLLDLDAYAEMAIQYSRGCPFRCEFCDIIVLYGRRPRTKAPEQMLAELQKLYDLGWRRSIFVVDDNFIGNKAQAKRMLRALHPWMIERGFPFTFSTEASVDLARDPELFESMVDCNFGAVFLGIETLDEESLEASHKKQNLKNPLDEAVATIAGAGLRIMAGFIIGFDGERPGAGQRIVDFVERNHIPITTFSMLQALPNTELWHRLKREGRLLSREVHLNQTSLLNFVPTRPVSEIAAEYVHGFYELFDPMRYLERTYRHYRVLGRADVHVNPARRKIKAPGPADPATRRALFTVFWRQGVRRRTRWAFWRNLWRMYRHNRGGLASYLTLCAYIEHFLPYRERVKDEISAQLEAYHQQGGR